MLDKIYEQLLSFGYPVEYGKCKKDYPVWNYIVYGRKNVSKVAQRDFADRYFVTIVLENYIPEGFDKEVIRRMESIPGLKLSKGEHEYDYTTNGKNNNVIEILVLEFVKVNRRKC